MDQRTRGILFGLCYFHGIVVERSKFGPKGFNIPYNFTINDLNHSVNLVLTQMETASSGIPWTVLKFMIGEIIYGGHVVNEFDRNVLVKYLDFFFRDEILDDMPMFPYGEHLKEDIFRGPSSSQHFDKIMDHIEVGLSTDSIAAFGLHSNTETVFRTDMVKKLLKSIDILQPNDQELVEGST